HVEQARSELVHADGQALCAVEHEDLVDDRRDPMRSTRQGGEAALGSGIELPVETAFDLRPFGPVLLAELALEGDVHAVLAPERLAQRREKTQALLEIEVQIIEETVEAEEEKVPSPRCCGVALGVLEDGEHGFAVGAEDLLGEGERAPAAVAFGF